MTNEGANKLLHKTLNTLNIEPISMHGLRHTHASVMLYKGASIPSGLGHRHTDYYGALRSRIKRNGEKR